MKDDDGGQHDLSGVEGKAEGGRRDRRGRSSTALGLRGIMLIKSNR